MVLSDELLQQAMVHELLGMNNNKVSLRGRPNIRKDLEEVVLSCTQDPFFATHRYIVRLVVVVFVVLTHVYI